MNNIQAKGFWLGTISGPTINFSIPGFHINLFGFDFGSSSLSIIGITDLGRFETKLSIPLAKWSWPRLLGMNFQTTSCFERFSTSFAMPEIAKKKHSWNRFLLFFHKKIVKLIAAVLHVSTLWKSQKFTLTLFFFQRIYHLWFITKSCFHRIFAEK